MNGSVTPPASADAHPYTLTQVSGLRNVESNGALTTRNGASAEWQPLYRPLVDRVNDRIARGEKFFSLEFFPPRTAQALANFYYRCARFARIDARPRFYCHNVLQIGATQ